MSANYTFLPWLKKGMGLFTSEVDNLENTRGKNGRPKLHTKLEISTTDIIEKDVELVGPGDIKGFNSRAVMRVWPPEGTKDFLPNHLSFIEFYEEELPWRFTPVIADSTNNPEKLRPWMALIVLKNEEFTLEQVPDEPFQHLTILQTAAELSLHNLKESWAWAHVHVNGTFSSLDDFKNMIDGDGDTVYSRIMCPRKLDANTRYTAFLVPTFEAGRKIGLNQEPYDGVDTDMLAPSWDIDAIAGAVNLPVYYNWSFSTAEEDDFEELIGRIKPEPVPEDVGNIKLDMQDPGPGIDMSNNTTEMLGMPCALKAAGTSPIPWKTTADETNFKNQLINFIDQGEQFRVAGIVGGESLISSIFGSPVDPTDKNDPVIVPPFYGQYHALQKELGNASSDPLWIKTLNLEPRNRAAAAIGASIVQDNQEKLMDSAWEQVGDIIAANQQIIQTEMAKNANYEAYRKFIYQTEDGKVIELTGAMVKKLLAGTQTVWKEITGSALPNASLSTQFKNRTKPRSKVSKSIGAQFQTSNALTGFRKDLHKNLADDSTKIAVNAATPKTAPASFPVGINISNANTIVADIESSGTSTSDYTIPQDEQGNAVSGNVFSNINQYIGVAIEEIPQPDLAVNQTSNSIEGLLDPDTTQAKRLNTMLGSIGGSFQIVDDSYQFRPVLATPEFEFPIYDLLKDKSVDFFMANLDQVPNNSISILESNYEFIESLLVGMSHEMGREMLWRSFPTDQRGTNFKHFWERFNPDTLEPVPDISSIHTWGPTTNMGESAHRPIGTENPAVGVVLMVRGDLLKKYPNTVLFAQEGVLNDNPTGDHDKIIPADYNDDTLRKYPIFEAKVDPDITFFGFSLSVAEVKSTASSGGWYFVFQERPGELAFGFDIPLGGGPKVVWEDFDWNDMLSVNFDDISERRVLSPNYIDANPTGSNEPNWGGNSADIAYAMFQKPVRVAIHADKMIYTP